MKSDGNVLNDTNDFLGCKAVQVHQKVLNTEIVRWRVNLKTRIDNLSFSF